MRIATLLVLGVPVVRLPVVRGVRAVLLVATAVRKQHGSLDEHGAEQHQQDNSDDVLSGDDHVYLLGSGMKEHQVRGALPSRSSRQAMLILVGRRVSALALAMSAKRRVAFLLVLSPAFGLSTVRVDAP